MVDTVDDLRHIVSSLADETFTNIEEFLKGRIDGCQFHRGTWSNENMLLVAYQSCYVSEKYPSDSVDIVISLASTQVGLELSADASWTSGKIIVETASRSIKVEQGHRLPAMVERFCSEMCAELVAQRELIVQALQRA